MEAGAEIMNTASALSVLDWWQEAGVDVMIDEVPRNWLAERSRPVARAVAAVPAPQVPAARTAMPETIEAFRNWLASHGALPDDSPVDRRVLPEGPEGGMVMILVDMPEAADAEAERLLSDETGQLLDRMLAAVGQDRGTAYLGSIALARPAGGRIDPAHHKALGRLARRHAALVHPRRLLLMGQATCQAVLGMDLPAARGQTHIINDNGVEIEAVATFAPRFLIQNPARKADAWKDLRLLTKGLEH